LATNESLYPWMDEGFTSYGENIVSVWLKNGNRDTANLADYNSYYRLDRSNFEEPLATHADHFNTNVGYSIASYSKGAVFLEQLGYITGAAVRDKILLDYYNTWKFKHPDVDDFIRIAEKVSDMKLDWYKEFWVNSTKTIDYAIDSVWEVNNKVNIRLLNRGLMPMPVDLVITTEDGKKELHYIPLDLMYGIKPAEKDAVRKVHPVWRWTSETYILSTDLRKEDVATIEIDPSQTMADVNRQNNKMNF